VGPAGLVNAVTYEVCVTGDPVLHSNPVGRVTSKMPAFNPVGLTLKVMVSGPPSLFAEARSQGPVTERMMRGRRSSDPRERVCGAGVVPPRSKLKYRLQ
jgi:hypothetical protein